MMETYHGYVRTPADAIKLFEACRLGLLPRVQRRLSEKERQSIRSGSVFVWDEREAGMRRWTDGKSWSASRVSGSFLTYREMEGKRGGGFGPGKRSSNKTPDSGRASDEDPDDGEPEGYRYKADGLMKQSFSITTSTGQHLHLISYYSRPQPGQVDLPQPSTDPNLRAIVPVKGMYPESSVSDTNQTPALTRTPMQPPYMMHGHPSQAAPPPMPHVPYGQHPQPGYSWPLSPAVTPPYAPSYAQSAPYAPAGNHHLPSGPLPPALPHAHAVYDRPPLPPPYPSKPAPVAPYQPQYREHRSPPPRLHDYAPQHELQAAAQAVMVDPRLNTTSARNPQGPLPAFNSVTGAGHTPPSLGPLSTPPTRPLSTSPPRSLYSDAAPTASNKAALSALLHPAPSGNEVNSANSSPRTCALAADKIGGSTEDERALRILNRKFCI
ncbi:Gti1/Pac2 family-domain-containing protein [Stachybotrys elegans]|uniref:Gti1/Pac2 family-domain-containing protein n=1 Tax=Stachybotrys elegans TaxID=80388 RepID=A0A8K0WTF6_9HYPO|nr:Gti1/Pac2 family-domain-containing protein [Stachybotrys elegans]